MGALLAGLDAFLIALAFAVVLLVVSSIIRPLLVSVLSGMPLVGGWLSSNVDQGLNRFQNAILGPANAALPVLSEALNWIVDRSRELLAATVALAEGTYAAAWQLGSVTLPHELSLALAQVDAKVEAAKGWALGQVQAAERRALFVAQSMLAQASSLISLEASRAREAELALEHNALAAVQAEAINAGKLFQEAERTAALYGQRAEGVAAQLAAGERLFASQAIENLLGKLAGVESAFGSSLGVEAANLKGQIAEAESRAGEALGASVKPIEQSVEGILRGAGWGLLVDLVQVGEFLATTNPDQYAQIVAEKIHEGFAQAEVIRARAQPIVTELRRDAATWSRGA